jgi:hypothetical protein
LSKVPSLPYDRIVRAHLRELGFTLNEGSLEYILDRRPYVIGDRD